MNEVNNENFINLYNLIERINYEFSKRIKFESKVHISLNEIGSLSFYFTIKYKGKTHSAETTIHKLELNHNNYGLKSNSLYYRILRFSNVAAKTILDNIKKEIENKENKEQIEWTEEQIKCFRKL